MLAPRRVTLPALRRDAARERAVQTRLVYAAEEAMARHVAASIARAGIRAAAEMRHGDRAAAERAIGGATREIERTMLSSTRAIARQFGVRVINGPKSAHAFLGLERKAFEDLDRAIGSHTAERTARRVVAIDEGLREIIRRTVEQGLSDQVGQEELAARIVEATSGDIGMQRARRIARTEIHNAAMYGQQAAAEASPLQFEKVWLATEDARTRTSHARANGQRVALDGTFVLRSERDGVTRLAYPGDSSAPPGETINCRCVCLYEPILDGDPVRTPMRREPAGAEPVPEGLGGVAEVEQVQVDTRPSDVDLEVEVTLEDGPPPPEAQPEPERPRERAASTVYAAGSTLNLSPDEGPTSGATYQIIGPNSFYSSPDATEVDRDIAARPALIFGLVRRPVLWRVHIPAGPAFPAGLVDAGGAGITINSGVGRFGLVDLRVTRVTRTTWGDAAPKDYIELDDDQRRSIETVIAAADALGSVADVQFALFGVFPSLPDSVRRTLVDTRWTKRALLRYLQRLLDGSIRDEAGPGEPSEGDRVIIADAVADFGPAIPGRTDA